MITSAHIFSDHFLHPSYFWTAPGLGCWGDYFSKPGPGWWRRVCDSPFREVI